MERADVMPDQQDNHEAGSWVPFGHTYIGGFKIVTASRADLAAAMLADCLSARRTRQRPRLVFCANGHALSLRETSETYRSAVGQADVIHADGGFLVSLSRWIGEKKQIIERSATTDMIHDCAQVAAENNLSFYIFGGQEEVNSQCVIRLKEMYPSLRIAGRRNGYFDENEENEIVAEINKTQPDVLWVGLGKPYEQIFSVKWRGELNCAWVVTCGGCYNYITGHYARAPLLLQKIHMEWIFRAFSSKELLFRYLITSPHAVFISVKYHFLGNQHKESQDDT
jgi:N-acetylglucosaminyldiphosphoundecaprenol N-acetyl-beta-D-mannosaminyltransferase